MTRANTGAAAVTGAGSGLGRDIAFGLAAKHYRVFGTAMNQEEIAAVQQASGGAVTLTRCDITDDDAVKRWARDVASQTDGSLDLLINNAGILTPGPLEVLPLEAIRREFDVSRFPGLQIDCADHPWRPRRATLERHAMDRPASHREDFGALQPSARPATAPRVHAQETCPRAP